MCAVSWHHNRAVTIISIAIRHSAIYNVLTSTYQYIAAYLHVLCESELDNWNVNVDKFLKT